MYPKGTTPLPSLKNEAVGREMPIPPLSMTQSKIGLRRNHQQMHTITSPSVVPGLIRE